MLRIKLPYNIKIKDQNDNLSIKKILGLCVLGNVQQFEILMIKKLATDTFFSILQGSWLKIFGIVFRLVRR